MGQGKSVFPLTLPSIPLENAPPEKLGNEEIQSAIFLYFQHFCYFTVHKGLLIKSVRKIFRKTNVRIRGYEMLDFRKILPT